MLQAAVAGRGRWWWWWVVESGGRWLREAAVGGQGRQWQVLRVVAVGQGRWQQVVEGGSGRSRVVVVG